jgi:hypothetical protein
MNSIDVNNIPTFQEYSVKRAIEKLSGWFIEQGYTTEINTAPSGNHKLKVIGLDWHQYAYRGDTDPVDGLLEPYDEETMIFIKQAA